MPIFFALSRTTPAETPDALTLPISSQSAGTKAANFFDGWTSPAGDVFTFGTPGGEKKFSESNFDGRIAARTTESWRDAEVTTYGQSFQALLRLTAGGKAFRFQYNANVAGGFIDIAEVSGINPALPIMAQNSPSNGAVVREIYSSADSSGTMTSRFGSSGTDVVANYSVTWASGHALTLGVNAFRIYVKFKGTTIIDLPYDGWTHMEAGQIALAPTAGYGILDSSVAFAALTVLDSVADGVAHPSNFSTPSAPVINLYDLGLKEIRQTGCSISASSTTLTVPDTSVWAVGDEGIIEAGQVSFTVTPGVGNAGDGAFVTGCPYLSTDQVAGDLDNWQTGTWEVEFTSASAYTVTRPDLSDGGTGATDCRYNDGITFQIMEGDDPFEAGDTFSIVCAASGETSTSTWDSKPAAGRNRTIGVGGVKPVQTLTQAQFVGAVNLGFAADTLAYISNNTSGNQGKVVYCGGGGIYELQTADPYSRNSRPQALSFTVVSILSGTTLQIDTAASATTANATVWFDAAPVFARVITGTDFDLYENVEVRIPEGDYAASEANAVSGTCLNIGGKTGWQLKGEGIDVTNIYQPRGVDGGFMQFSSWEDGGTEAISDFSVYGNDHPNGGFARQINANPNILTQIPTLVQFLGPVNTSINRVKVVNSRGQSLDVSQGFNSFIRNCVALKTVPALAYSGWLINMSDCNNVLGPCGLIDNTITCSWLQGAHETFSSESGTISGFTMTNGVMSTNSSNGYTISDAEFRFTKNCYFRDGPTITAIPALSVSSNQEHVETTGGTISNVNFIYEGYLNELNEMHNVITVELSPAPGVVIDGTYNPLVADDGNREGLISRPDWIAGNPLNAAMIRVTDGSVATITNYRFIGDTTLSSYPQVLCAGGTVTANNNVVDSAGTAGGAGTFSESGNVTNAEYDGLAPSGMPDGADAIWYAEHADTGAVRQHIPNEVSLVTVPTWVNETPKPRVALTTSSVSASTGIADSFGGHNGVRLIGTGGSWYARDDDAFINFKAMQYTLVVIGKSNSGGSETAKLNFGFSGGGGTTVTFNTTLTRVSHNAVKSAGNDNPFILSSSGGNADITIERWFVYEGADPYPGDVDAEEYGGHLLLGGASAYASLPTVASNEVDINSASKLGRILFDSFRNLASFTAFATVRKVASTPSGLNTIYAATTANTYGDLGLFADYSNGTGFYFRGPYGTIAYRQAFDPGVNTLFELLDQGYNVLVWKYDAATDTGSFWVNDVLMAGEITDRSALADFQGLLFNLANPHSSVKWNSGAFYPTALSRANIESAVTALQAKAVTNGLTLDTTANFVFFEGDSNTDGSGAAIGIGAPGGGSWPYLYAPNASEDFYGAPFALNGGKLSDMVARAAFINDAVPTVPAGRKFILVGMIGTNDASTNYTDIDTVYLADLLAYWGAAKAAGWTTIGMPILPRTDINVAASPPFDTWRGTINAGLLAAVGDELDACLDPADVPLLFANGASDNTTYFHTDKVHLKPAGQVLLEAAIRPIINSFL